MSWNHHSGGDSRTTIGLLVVGGVLLFSHGLFPLIWWNFLGGSTRYNQYPRVPTVTPTTIPPVLPLAGIEPTAPPERSETDALLAGDTAPSPEQPVLPMVTNAASPDDTAPTPTPTPLPASPQPDGGSMHGLGQPFLPMGEDES